MATIKGVFSKHSNRNLNVFVQHKGNPLYTQQRLLDQTLEDPKKNYNDKVMTVLESWERVGASVRSINLEVTRKVILDLYCCTVLVVLNDGWDKVKPAVKTHFKVTVEKCASEFANREEKESESRCRAILRLVEEPWGRNLKSVIGDTPCSESDAERFLNSDRLILRLRLQTLLDSRRLNMALQLVELVWHWRRARPDFFSGYTNRELDYMAYIYLILLYALKREKDIIIKLKGLELRDCHQVVTQLLSLANDDLSSGERRLCRHAPKIAKLGAQLLLTKAMLGAHTPELEEYVQIWVNLHKDMASDPEMIRRVMTHAHPSVPSISHVVTFCKVLQKAVGDSQRLVCIELYIRSLTNEMNLMERHRTNHEMSEAHETELRLSEGFLELSHLLQGNLRVRRECVLTAFSLNPTPGTLDRLSSMADLPENLDTGQPTNDNTAELTPESSLDASSLGLTESLCNDLLVVLFCHRYQNLKWNSGWTRLEEECKSYLKSVESGARNADPELKYLNIDYEQFKDWPEEEDADNGIERGYEPTTTSEEDDDEEEEEEESESENSDFPERRHRRLKKTKPLSESSDDTVSEVLTKAGAGRPRKYTPRRGRAKFLHSDTKMGFQFPRKESNKSGRPLGRPPLSRTKRGMRLGARGRPVDRLMGRPGVGTTGKPAGRPSGRPLGRPPSRLGRPGPRPVLRPVPRPISRPVVRLPVMPMEQTVRRIGRPPTRHIALGRPPSKSVNNVSSTNTSVKVESKYPALDEDEVKNLLSPNKTQSSPSVVKTLRNFRTPRKKQKGSDSPREDGVSRFAPMLSTLNLNPKVVLDRQDRIVEQYMSNSKQKGGLTYERRKSLANSVPGLDSLDMIVPCPQQATVQVVQISGQMSSEGPTVKTEPEDEEQCPDHVNGKTANQTESNPSSGGPAASNNFVENTDMNLVTDNHSLTQDSTSSMQVSSTQGGNERDHRDVVQVEARSLSVRGNVVSSSHNWQGGPPKPETAANAIKKTDKRSGHRRQMSTQTASLPQFHQAFGKQVYPGQQGASGESRATPASGTSPATGATATATTPSGTPSGAARGNALKQALAGGNSARLIQVPGEPSLLLQAISSDNVVQQEVKLPISTGTPIPEKQRPSMLMKQLTSPVAAAHAVKPPTNLVLTSTGSAVIVNSTRPVTESHATKSVNTQTTASPREAVITCSPAVVGRDVTPTSRSVTAQSVYLVKRKPVVQASTGTGTGAGTGTLSTSAVSSSQNAVAINLSSDEERTHRASLSVAFNRRVRRTPLTAATLKFVKPVERFPAPMLGLLNQASSRLESSETPLTSSSQATSPATRPLRQQTPPALVTSTTLEQQLREFESVLEQVTTTSQLKERRLNPEDPSPTTPPVTTASVSFSGEFSNSSTAEKPSQLELQEATPSASNAVSATPSPVVTSAVSVTFSTQPGVVQTLHKLSPIVVSTSFTQTQPVAVASPASVTSQSSSSPSTTPSSSVPGTPSKSSKSKPKSVKTSAVQASVKTSPIAKTQKTQEDEQTTARILSILRQYDEQLRCSPDLNNKPAPRRRNNHQTHPSPNSKRKKSGSKSKPSSASDMSPSTDDTHTLGSEDSSGMASQPSGDLGDPSLTEDERASIFSAAPSPVITAAVPPSTTPSPTPSLVVTANTASQQTDTSPKTITGETKTEPETKSFSNVMPVYMVPVSSASSLPVVVSTGTQMLHVHPVGPNGAPLVGVGLGGNVQVPVVVRQIPAKQLSSVNTLEGAVQTQSANSTSAEIGNAGNTESRCPDTILLNVTTPTRTGNTPQSVMAIMPTFHLTTVSSANTSSVTPTTHIRLPAVSTNSSTTPVATTSSDTSLTVETETAANARPPTLLGLQLLQQQRSAKQRAQPKSADQPSQLQQLLSQDQPTASLQPTSKQGHVFMKSVCVMKSVKEQEPPILLQLAKVRDDNQESTTNQLTVQVSSPQHRVLKPSQPTTVAATSTDPVAHSEPSQQVVLMRQTPVQQPVSQVEQVQQHQALQLVQAQQTSQTQATETEPPKLQVEPSTLQTIPKAKPPAQPTLQTQPVRPALQTSPQQAGSAQHPIFTLQIAQRQQQVLNLRTTHNFKHEQKLQLDQQAMQIQHQAHQIHLQLHQKHQLLQQKRMQAQSQPQPLHHLPLSVPPAQQIEPKIEVKEEPPESPPTSLEPAASSLAKELKEEETRPSTVPRSSPQRFSPQCSSPQRSSPQRSSPQRSSPQRSSPQRPSPQRCSPERCSPERFSPQRLSPQRSSPQRSLPRLPSPQLPSPQRPSPHRTPPSPSLSPTTTRNTSAPESENTNESGLDSPASSNTIHLPSSGIDGDTSPDRSPGGPISCWRYNEPRADRDRVKLTAKLPARVHPTVSKPANKRKPALNMYPCSLSKSLSEECEDLGVDRPSTRELFPDTDLFLDSNLSPSYAHTDSPSNSQDGVSTSPEPPDKKKKYPVLRSFSSQKTDISTFLCGSEAAKDERKQNGEPLLKCSEVPIDSITAGVALASEVTAASPLPALASLSSNRDEASSPDASMVFMHQGRVTTYARRRDSRPIWEREPLRPSSAMDEDFWHEPLVDDKDDASESIPDLDGHCSSPASNGTDPLANAGRVPSVAAGVAAAVAAVVSTTSMTTRRGALKRKDVVDTVKRDVEKKTEKKVRRSAPSRPAMPQEPEEEEVADEKRGSVLRSKRTAMNRTEVFPRDMKKRMPEEGPWRETSTTGAATTVVSTSTTTTTATTTGRRTSLRARVPGQPGSPALAAPGANFESMAVVSAPKSVTKLDRNSKRSKPIKVVHKKK